MRQVPQAVDAKHPSGRWQAVEPATPSEDRRATASDPAQTTVRWSPANTLGIWVAAFLTLAVLSFLANDNPAYKIAESLLVGVSAAYWMVVAFWEVLVPNLLGRLWPGLVQAWALPGLEAEPEPRLPGAAGAGRDAAVAAGAARGLDRPLADGVHHRRHRRGAPGELRARRLPQPDPQHHRRRW